MLRRYWFEFDPDHVKLGHTPVCGVTAWSEADALQLISEQLFSGDDPPPIRTVVPDFDVSTLDADRNVRPNIGVPTWRGVWYPFLTQS